MDSSVRPPLTTLISVVLGLLLVSALLPAGTLAAGEGKAREYIVTLSVADSGRAIQPSSRSARQRISRRADRVKTATKRLAAEHEFKARHRYGGTFTGFSAKLTETQAAKMRRDSKVVSIRRARQFRTASEVVANGVKRVLAAPKTTAAPDIEVDVAVLDTGIGPAEADATPLAMGPSGKPELRIAGGINCADDGANPGNWGDTHGHGTHVAGIIGARDNNVGTVGVAPGVRLWSVRTFGGAYGSEAAILCGLDWVNATHSNSNPDIDVLNMSIEGPRSDYLEDCSQILGNPEADPMHQGVCTATQLGITVVAAAGNKYMNANQSVPGGYDQVISVGALADTDGTGGRQGGLSGCSDSPGQSDDTYASWSNYGSEIDIVAPGVCITSTAPHTSGDVVRTLSGTSQAAPHVTGAVARYLAQKPSTTPDKMRRLIRAAGRMDWDAKSDPLWSGIWDSDEPNRVLDVKALMGEKKAKVWLQASTFTASGTDKTRNTRVDIQRRGGFAGTANLSVTGLPSAVGTASFGSASLDWLTGLGTNVTLQLKTSGPDGNYQLGVKANGSGIEPYTRALSLKVDRTGPVISNLAPRVRSGNIELASGGKTETRLNWGTKDKLSKVESAKLQRKIGTGAWKATGSSRVTLKPGQQNKFRVKATDSLGNRSTSAAISARLWVRDSKSVRWNVPKSDWKTRSIEAAHGGSVLLGKGSTASLTTTFTGKSAGIVSSMGPGRGTFRVRIDGGVWTKVKLKAAHTKHRQVVWSRNVNSGTHTLEIRGLEGQTVIDAALIIQ